MTVGGSGRQPLELHLVDAFQTEHLSGLSWRRRLETKLFDDAAYFCNLLCIARRQFARADVERVFETDTHVAADHRCGRAEIELVAAAGEHRPEIVLAEQPIGCSLHEVKIVEVR